MRLEKNLQKILIIDFGSQFTQLIARKIRELGVYCEIVSSNKIIKKKKIEENVKGLILSGGPLNVYQNNKIKFNKNLLLLKIPVLGICLGHQILSLALGAKTSKMHLGHRGANHPVKNLKTKKVEITSQNHGFKVEEKSIPSNVNITHLSLFDKSIEGIELKNKPVFSVQYHPEASPGPHDSRYVFDKFFKMMDSNA